VDQPSPLPQGVSERAVGGEAAAVLGAEVPSTPEPSAWVAMVVAALLIASAVMNRRVW
jgi:Ca-activated chloride channel homolog